VRLTHQILLHAVLLQLPAPPGCCHCVGIYCERLLAALARHHRRQHCWCSAAAARPGALSRPSPAAVWCPLASVSGPRLPGQSGMVCPCVAPSPSKTRVYLPLCSCKQPMHCSWCHLIPTAAPYCMPPPSYAAGPLLRASADAAALVCRRSRSAPCRELCGRQCPDAGLRAAALLGCTCCTGEAARQAGFGGLAG
jgi:hypothetical protein